MTVFTQSTQHNINDLTIGIRTIKRPKIQTLPTTIKSFINYIPKSLQCKIVACSLNTETDTKKCFYDLQNNFKTAIQNQRLVLHQVTNDYSAKRINKKSYEIYNGAGDKLYWQDNLTFDFIATAKDLLTHFPSRIYLILEDDVIVFNKRTFAKFITSCETHLFAENAPKVLSFGPGATSLAFTQQGLLNFIQYLEEMLTDDSELNKKKPLDFFVWDYEPKSYKPTVYVFFHIGWYSTSGLFRLARIVKLMQLKHDMPLIGKCLITLSRLINYCSRNIKKFI